MVSLKLNWPPSVNHYWVHTHKGVYIGLHGIRYRTHVCLEAIELQDYFSKEDRLKVTIIAYPPDRRKRDLDNLLKALLDSLQHSGVYPDDSQIDELTIERNERFGGYIEVTIERIQKDSLVN